MIGPQQSAEVLRDASLRAGRARGSRAEVKRRIRDGETLVAEVFEATASGLAVTVSQALGAGHTADEVAHALARMRIVDLILALPGYGNVSAEMLMQTARISPQRRIRGLGQRQREEILSLLGEQG